MKVNLSENEAAYCTSPFTPENVNLKGAEFAVAKALNLFPSLGGECAFPLVGRTHARIGVIYNPSIATSYVVRVENSDADVLVVVTGSMPNFEIQGFGDRKTVVEIESGDRIIYHHILTPMMESFVFLELLNDSRNWKTVYEKDDKNTWTTK